MNQELEKELRKKEEELALLAKLYESVQQKILDLTLLIETVKELKPGKGLINVGGVFAEGDVTNSDKLVVPVGANYFVETSKEEVIETLSKQLEQLKEEKEKIAKELEKVQSGL